jgi:D-alanine transaminase
MSRIAYVNGQYLPHQQAAVHIEDRGYQFADGVYEVVPIVGGRLIDEKGHLDRLWRSLGELRMDAPMARAPLQLVMRQVIRRNGVENGLIYMQVTRGVAPRDHAFPRNVPPSLVMTAKRLSMAAAAAKADRGVSVITVPDIRWARRDIKSTSLLPNILAKQQAVEQGAYEAFQVDEQGYITEGSSTNAWMVDADGTLVTRPTGRDILAGITREALISLLRDRGIRLELRPFSLEELHAAREVFLTSSTSYVLPVTKVDDRVIGNGRPGSISADLRKVFKDYMDN